jgi:chemotaxis protein methyltransferase CheR
MNSIDFDIFATYLRKASGLVLTQEKAYLLESRLTPLIREMNIADLSTLAIEVRRATNQALMKRIVDVMTTNETSFLRDGKPFDNFRKFVLPALVQKNAATKKIRIWSAACSSGQEPYTLAMLWREEAVKYPGWSLEIVGTDISSEILAKAKAGEYSQFEVQRGLPIQLLMKYFTQNGDRWQIKPDIQNMVSFKSANLLESFAAFGKFDIIFCRNVLIYFDAAMKKDILERMSGSINPNGYLVLGGAETVIGVTEKWAPVPDMSGLYTIR